MNVYLYRYVDRLYSTIESRKYLEVESLTVHRYPSGISVRITGRLLFYDGSMLEFSESLWVNGTEVDKLSYGYHYQDEDETLIFRYDNAPHFRNIITYPHHKHVGGVSDDDEEQERVEPSSPPNLDAVLREIEAILF